MSIYDSAADKAEQQLKQISPTMCYAKWAQVSLHLTNGKTHSCYHPPTHDIDVEEIETNPSAIHNTKQKKIERAMMLNGERPEGCSYCWNIEDVGGRSDRIYRSGEYWAQNARKDIIASTETGDINPRYVEVNFNQACNFKCSYCSPHLSNTWEEEIRKLGDYKILDADENIIGHNNLGYLEEVGLLPKKLSQKGNPYLNAFWKWWPDLYKTLEVFRMTGGEPLMDSNTFKVLDYVYENPNAWLELSVTSNMCPPKGMFDKFLEKVKKLEEIQIWESERFNPGSGNHWYVNMAVKNFALFISLDSVGKQAEYIRHGLDYDVLTENANRFLDETCNTTVTFINTFNLLSLPKAKEYMKMILNYRTKYSRENQGTKFIPIYDEYNTHPDFEVHPRQRIWFDVPLLRYPDWQTIQVLPEIEHFLIDAIDFMKQNPVDDNFIGFYDFEIEKMERNLAFMKERKCDPIAKTNFMKFFSQHDKRRGTNLIETFPELQGVEV